MLFALDYERAFHSRHRRMVTGIARDIVKKCNLLTKRRREKWKKTELNTSTNRDWPPSTDLVTNWNGMELQNSTTSLLMSTTQSRSRASGAFRFAHGSSCEPNDNRERMRDSRDIGTDSGNGVSHSAHIRKFHICIPRYLPFGWPWFGWVSHAEPLGARVLLHCRRREGDCSECHWEFVSYRTVSLVRRTLLPRRKDLYANVSVLGWDGHVRRVCWAYEEGVRRRWFFSRWGARWLNHQSECGRYGLEDPPCFLAALPVETIFLFSGRSLVGEVVQHCFPTSCHPHIMHGHHARHKKRLRKHVVRRQDTVWFACDDAMGIEPRK